MRILAHFLCGVLLCAVTVAQEHASHAQSHPVTLVTGLGDLHHPVSTKNAQAQQFFDQGLRFIYAFNHDDPADPNRYKRAHEAVQKAVGLSPAASSSDRAYTQALAKRFPADPNSD